MGNVCRQEVICKLVKFFDSFNVGAYDCFLLLKNTDIAINFCIAELVVLEVPESSGNLVFPFVIEQDKESTRVVVYLELGAHRLLDSSNQATGQDDVIDWVPFKLTDIVRAGLCVHYHSYGDRSEHLRLPWFVILLIAPLTAASVAATRAVIGGVVCRWLI